MNSETIIGKMSINIFLKVKTDIDTFKEVCSYNVDYWKGYCNAIEDANNIERNQIWFAVYKEANAYYKTQRKRNRVNVFFQNHPNLIP